MINHFFGLNIPNYVFIIIMIIILAKRARNYIARNCSKDSFLYRHFVTRLAPKVTGITLGLITSFLFEYFEAPDLIRLSFMIALLSLLLIPRIGKINNHETEWPWEK